MKKSKKTYQREFQKGDLIQITSGGGQGDSGTVRRMISATKVSFDSVDGSIKFVPIIHVKKM